MWPCERITYLSFLPYCEFGWGYTHNRRADKSHDCRADKDSYPHDRNVTDDLCSLIKLYFAIIMVNFSTKCVLLLFMFKSIYFKKCLNHIHKKKKKKKKCIINIDQSVKNITGDKN